VDISEPLVCSSDGVGTTSLSPAADRQESKLETAKSCAGRNDRRLSAPLATLRSDIHSSNGSCVGIDVLWRGMSI
jgi:hypothetical protein